MSQTQRETDNVGEVGRYTGRYLSTKTKTCIDLDQGHRVHNRKLYQEGILTDIILLIGKSGWFKRSKFNRSDHWPVDSIFAPVRSVEKRWCNPGLEHISGKISSIPVYCKPHQEAKLSFLKSIPRGKKNIDFFRIDFCLSIHLIKKKILAK